VIDIQYTKSHIGPSLRNKSHISHHNIGFYISARPIWKTYFEFNQVVYYDTASLGQWIIVVVIHPLAVTERVTVADPVWRRGMSPCANRLPTPFYVSQQRRETDMSTQIDAIGAVCLSFMRKRVVAQCKFGRAPGFPAHKFLTWAIRAREQSPIK